MFGELLPSKGEMKKNVFIFPIRVYYEDTDAGGIVYYANYLKFAERARTEFIRSLGINQQDELEKEDRCGFAVREVNIQYKRPAVLDDALVVTCEVLEAKGAGACVHQDIYRNDELLACLDVQLAYLSLEKKRPVRIPEVMLAKIKSENI